MTAAPPTPSTTQGRLETALRAARGRGRKLLVPYLTGGMVEDWTDYLDAALDAGADAVEVGIPFSDPAIDGAVIQHASTQALRRGTTLDTIVADLAGGRPAPLVAMTYYNLVLQAGHQRFASRLLDGGICAAILPDLPVDESTEWERDSAAAGVEAVQLVAPSTPDDRLATICARSRGFVYGIGLMGVTGERSRLASSAVTMATRLKTATDKPVLIGVGVSTPDSAAETCAVADGVAVGAPVVRRVLEGESPAAIADLLSAFRQAIDRT